MEKKQSSIDWLVEEINKQKAWADPSKLEPIIEQAKQMEKEQMIDAIVQVMMKQLNIWSESGIIQLVNNAEQYYNENYGGNNE